MFSNSGAAVTLGLSASDWPLALLRLSALQCDWINSNAKHILRAQLRDLRLLDPQLATSYPSAILARDAALVLNLEFVKAVVTRDCVLILNPGAAAGAPPRVDCNVASSHVLAVEGIGRSSAWQDCACVCVCVCASGRAQRHHMKLPVRSCVSASP